MLRNIYLFIRITDVKKLKMFSFKTDTIIHISLYTYGCKLKSRCRTESHLIPKLYLLSFFDLFKTLFQNQYIFLFSGNSFSERDATHMAKLISVSPALYALTYTLAKSIDSNLI